MGVFNLLGLVKSVQKRLQFRAAMFYNTLLNFGWQLFGGRALFADKVLFQLVLVAVHRFQLEEGVLREKLLQILFTRELNCSVQESRTDGLHAWQTGGLEIRVKIGSVFTHVRNETFEEVGTGKKWFVLLWRNRLGDRRHGVHIFEINVFKLVPDEVVVRSVGVAELGQVSENVFHLRNVARRRPEQLLWVG